MEPKGEQEAKDAKEEGKGSPSEEHKEKAKKVADEKTPFSAFQEEEKLYEDEEGSEGYSDEEEEEEVEPIQIEKPPEPVKKKKVKVEKKISENFYYNYEELCALPFVTPDSGIPLDLLSLIHSFGYDCTRRANIQMLDSVTLFYIAGNQLVMLNLLTKSQNYLRSTCGGGIGVIAVHPNKTYFAVGEKGWKPNMIIYEYPSLRPYRVLRGGTEEAYAFADFNRSGTLIATVGSSPDYMLTVWDWKQEKIVLRAKAFSQDVFRVTFSPENEEQLTTSGSGHIKFWKMALTFTGLKLQGALGRFGKTALTDIEGYVELPDGKVLSGSEWGNLLLWEGGLIKVELCRPGRKNCHNGPINQIILDEGEVVSVGSDGFIRVWDFETIDTADIVDDTGLLEVEHINELLVGKNVNLNYMVKIHERGEPFWYAQDANGAIWKLDLSFTNVTHDPECLFTFHSGKIEAMCVSPVTYIMATTGLDRTVRVFDFVDNVQLTEMKFKQGGTVMVWAPNVVNPKKGIMVVGFQDGVVRVIELFDPKGLPVVSGRDKGAPAALRLKQAFKPHTTIVTALAYERNGELLATGSNDKTVFFFTVEDKYEAIGFISVPGPVQALQWSPLSHPESTLLILCKNGIVVQVPAPDPGNYNAATTYRIKDLPTQYFRFSSIKSRILLQEELERREKVRLEKEKAKQEWIQQQLNEGKTMEEIEFPQEEAVEEEPLPEIYIPETPSPILCGFYSRPGKFWLSLGEYDTGFLFHCAFSHQQGDKEPEARKDEPFAYIHLEDTDDTAIRRIVFCSTGLLMICGMQDGAVRIYALYEKSLSKDNIAGYWSYSMHDNNYGQIQGIYPSFDDRFLVTCGADGNIFTYNILSAEEVKKVLKAKVPSPRRGLEKERAAEDIVDPTAYSIENAKQKKEHDYIMRIAEKKKSIKRQELSTLREEFQNLLQMNRQLPSHMQFHRAQFELDRRIRAEMDRKTAHKIRLVLKELAWEQEKHRIGLRKVENRFRASLEYDTIVVCAMRSNHRISTYRLLSISEKLYNVSKQSQAGKRRTSKYDHKGKDTDQRTETQKDAKPKFSTQASISEEEVDSEKLPKKAHPHTVASRIVENRMEKLRKIIEKADRAKAKIQQRRSEWEELFKSKPSDDYEDPQDVENIKEAQQNMGDFKLKTATNYKIPEHMRINADKKTHQLASLEVAIHDKKLEMNKWIVSLRDLKVAIIEEIQCVVQELKKIQSSLHPSQHVPVPPIPQLLPEETPEKQFQYDSERLMKFKRDMEEQVRLKETVQVAPSGEGGGLGGFGGGFYRAPSVKDLEAAMRSTSLKSMKIASGTAQTVKTFEFEAVEPTELEVEIAKRGEIRNIYMQEVLVKRVHELMITFDAELRLLRHQKLKLDIMMKTADLRHITWFQELLLLKNFEKHENILQERVNSLSSEEEEMQNKLNSYLAQIEEKKAEIAKLQEREKILYATFQVSLGENNKFANFLTKVLKKRIKRVKKKEVEGEGDEDEESEEESDEESSLESDEEESGSEDEVFDDSVCPKNCDEALFENTLLLREKRLDIEEALVEEKKTVENVKKDYDVLAKKVKVVAASLDAADWELEAYQREKQQRLNELYVVVPLKLHQVEYISNGEIPSDLSQSLVFTNQSLVNLQQRIIVLQEEKLEQRELYKKARQQHKQLIRDRRDMMLKIDRLEEKCNELMMLKFGRLVNLEALQTLSVNTNLEELRMKMMEKEQAQAAELRKWEDKIVDLRQELMMVTQENTGKLKQMNTFCMEKMTLETKLDALQNNLGAEFQGPRKADIEEKEKLIALVQLQAQEAEVLKEEITLLSRKDGRIFPPSQPGYPQGGMLD
ncbi:cilia- and flagella-associated protein 44 isoform X1 [Zootoca vivipara]|uniref:cilia- and flagella-associated protein 44 isoform X1 n=1 Tax=Zootoca vivipara TaxID=8524 RepID=UPI001592593F|nr:cilia- and flagella-associated protein 44 isoform X1 [Zootoca vivipara]